MMHLIGFLISGLIIGLIARALKPGDDRMSLGLTTILGMIGALLAGFVGRSVGWYGPEDSAGFIASTIGAIAAISGYYLISRNRVHHV